MGFRPVILAPIPCVQAALSVLQIAKSKITTYPGARPFLVPLHSEILFGRRLFLAVVVVPAASPQRESRKSLLYVMLPPPPQLSNSFPNVDFLCFCVFEFPEQKQNVVLSSRPEGERPGSERGTPQGPGSVGPKCGAHSVVGAQHSRCSSTSHACWLGTGDAFNFDNNS